MKLAGPSAFLLAATAALGAQTAPAPPAQPPAPRDAQSAFEPRGNPGKGQVFLKRFEGDWDVEKVFYPPSGGAPVRTHGTCRQFMIHEGRWLQSDFTFDDPGGKTSGMGLTGFDPATSFFQSVWTDSRSTRMSLRQSDQPFDGENIVLRGRTFSTDPPPRGTSRTNAHLEDGDRRLIHRQWITGPDGKEKLVLELIMTRKGAA